MKKQLLAAIVFGLFSIASTGWSYMLVSDSTNVGAQDTLLQAAKLKNSGEATELAWVQTFFPDTDFILKQDGLTGTEWQKVNYGDLWALPLLSDADYFLVKTGNTGTFTHYLFKNLDELSWAVISLADVNITSVVGVQKISHVSEYGGAPVPEPGTFLLLGTGLLGLAIYGKRRRNT
ncbi:PEP-CTERM sorting domain-containing protein [Geomonas oryzae]|uniref:PEP-CTERM sorting domain-containing protein n=1 Tax=Geomonas oryzae TaxID=2364273 RepID=UPI001FEC93C4|nr:PEP-CTERM sorting domain-containing protein [Geomonas oryzae]